jgi:dolichol-phosphate mannosyltransferase
VFHLAAHGAYSAQTDWQRMAQSNIVGTAQLVEACVATGFEAFVNTGSSSEYGYKDHAPAEDELLEPNSHYAITKASATLYCQYTARHRNVRIPTLRLYSVYGPLEEPSRLIPTIIVHGLRGEFPPLVNPGVAPDFVYIDDVCDAYILAATTHTAEWGAVYNVGTGVQTRLRDVAAAAQRLFGINREPHWGTMPNRQWDTQVWVADHRKITEQLGWRPRVAFPDGLFQTTNWLRSHAEYWTAYRYAE